MGLPGGISGKEPTCQCRRGGIRKAGLIPGSGRAPKGGNGNPNPHQYSYLEYLLDRGGWQASVHSVTKNQA